MTCEKASNILRLQEMAKIHDQIRRLIDRSSVSRYQISKETGIGEAQLSKFMNHIQDLKLDSLQVLADYFDHEIVLRRKPKGGK